MARLAIAWRFGGPLIVANKHHDAAQIGAWVRHVIGTTPRLQKVTDLLIGLRERGLGD